MSVQAAEEKPKVEETKRESSDQENLDIAAEAYKEVFGDGDEKKKKDDDEPIIEIDADGGAKEKQATEEEKKPEIVIEEEKKPGEEKKPDSKTPEEKAAEEKAVVETEKVQFEEDVKAYIAKHNVAESVARADVEGIHKQIKHYGGDVKQLAKALLNSQRGYSRLEQEHKVLKESATEKESVISPNEIKAKIDSGDWLLPTGRKDSNGNDITRTATKSEIVSLFVKQNPDITEDLEDDKVYALACKAISDRVNDSKRRSIENIPERAKAKRAEIVANLKDAINPEYAEELKESISELSDSDILNPDFDVKYASSFIKGLHYDDAVKKAETAGYERGLKEGKENIEILKRDKVPTGGGTGAGGKVTIVLTPEQKTRAKQMFQDAAMTDTEKYLAFVEVHEDEFPELKKKPKK